MAETKPKKITPKSLGKNEEDKNPPEPGAEIPERISSVEDKGTSSGLEQEDYIRQYQYKKVNNVPTVGGVLTDPEKGSKAEVMKASLLKQRRVSILIPLEAGSSPKVPYSVTLNGYRLDLPVQEYIDVPEQIAQKIRDANNQTVAALSKDRIDGDEKKTDALS